MDEGYSADDLARLLGVTPARLQGLLRATMPGGGERERFSFQDLLLLRTARGLAESNVSSARIRLALQRLRDQLPEGRPLTGVSITADGERLVAQEGGTRWRPESGQVLMDFGTLAPPPAPAGEDEGPTADEWFQLGCELEEREPRRAQGAYRRALAVDGAHADAHVNLGRLLHEQGDLPGAEEHYRAALRVHPGDATAAYNLGIALEDQRRWKDAIAAYSDAIARHPGYADAHYNLARLYERLGEKVAALRHFKAARQIARR